MRTLPVFYSTTFTQSEYEFDTTRKATWVAASLSALPIEDVTLTEPLALTDTALELVHAPEYVKAVRTGQPRWLAQSSGLEWDPRVWDAVCVSNGGAVTAAKAAWESRANAGSLSSGLHHASIARGSGFCTFNGLALAARAVLDAGARRVLILDLDAHCGGGTHAIVRDWPGVVHLDISVSPFDHYEVDSSTGSTLDIVTEARTYLPALRRRLAGLDRSAFDLVIYNAGVDPHQDCDIGGLRGITSSMLAERETIVFEWARDRRLPVAFVLAGGYVGDALTRDALVDLHRQTVAAACRM